MKQKLWTRLLLALICAALLLLLGCGDETGSTASNVPDAPASNASDAFDPDAPVVTGESASVDQAEAEAVYLALLQSAIATGEPKQVWAEDFCTEQRKEAEVWRCELLDCEELGEELLELLLPGAEVKEMIQREDGIRYELRLGVQVLACTCEPYSINITLLTQEQARELLPRAKEWLEEKCGLEFREWTGPTGDATVYTARIDDLPVVPKQKENLLFPWYCRLWGDRGSIKIEFPFTLGEQAGTVSLNDMFSPEELRTTLEFGFDPSRQVVEVYRSCELCYLPDGQRQSLVPVWRVRGNSCDLQTGAKKSFERWFDAETGQEYDRMEF